MMPLAVAVRNDVYTTFQDTRRSTCCICKQVRPWGVAVDDGRLIIEPKPRPRYTLAELLAASDYSEPQPAEEREWIDAPAVGRELI